MRVPRLAFFSPVPPLPSGISDYTVDLLAQLPKRWNIELFVGDATAGPVANRDCWSHLRWAARHRQEPFDLNVYQVGNNVAHAYMLPYVLEAPGLLVLHDAVMNPSRTLCALASGNLTAYRRAIASSNKDSGRALGHLVAAGLATPSLYWTIPLCEDLVRASKLTAVHGELMAAWLRALVPGGRVTTVTHWRSVPEAEPTAVTALRSEYGADIPLVGSFGHIGPAHRLESLIDALALLREQLDFRLLVVGEVDPELAVERRVRAAGLENRVVLLGSVPPDRFGLLMRTVDLAVNLRYPTARSSSGVLQQLLQLGVPCIISDLIHLRDLPDAAVLRISVASPVEEHRALVKSLRRWIGDPKARRRASTAALAWAEERVSPVAMAASYERAVNRALGKA